MMHRTLGLTALLLCTTASNADVSDNWKTECVGRYQLGVPGEVDVAMDKLTHKGTSSDASYTDGQETAFAKLDYFGDISIISPASEADFIKFKNIILNNRDKAKQEYLKSNAEREKKWVQGMKPIAYNTPSMFGWDCEDSHPRISYFRDNKIFSYSPAHFSDRDNSQNIKHYNSFLNDFRTRALFEVPKQEGVCIPYGFIPDDGKQPREIAVSMRLIDHPDVEISFSDGFVEEDPKEIMNTYVYAFERNTRKIEADLFGFRTITMDGREGKGLYYTVTRNNDKLESIPSNNPNSPFPDFITVHHPDTEDYGFLAYVKGDSSATVDTPGLVFRISRTAARAKGSPVSKSELKDIAKKIIASVKRHPVQ